MGNLFGNIKDLKADESAEVEGIDLAFGNGRFITIARSGGANRKYRTALSEAYKPHKMALEHGTMDDDLASDLLAKVFAKSIVLDWTGWLDDRQEEIPFTPDACVELFKEAPEIFILVKEEADKFSNFTQKTAGDSGN